MPSSAIIGISASLLAALFFSLYPVPRRHVESGINDFMISMTVGVLLSGSALSVIYLWTQGGAFSFGLSPKLWGMGFLAGGMWCIATVLYVSSVDCIGVGRATPIKNITAVVGLMVGLVLFQEYRGLSSMKFIYLSTGTLLVVIAGKVLGSLQGRVGISAPTCPTDLSIPNFFDKGQKTVSTAGWTLAVGAALLYGFQSGPVKVLTKSTDTVFHFLPAVGVGALVTSLFADMIFTTRHSFWKVPGKGHLIAILSGFLWTIAFIGLTTGIKLVSLSVAWPIAMSSTVFAVLYALLAREIDFSSNKRDIFKGLIAGISGIILLGLSI